MKAKIHSKIEKFRFGVLGGTRGPRRLRPRFLARSWPVRAHFKIFGGPGGTSDAFLRSTWAARARFWVARTLPGSILEAETLRFSGFVTARAPVPARPFDPYKILHGRTNFELRAFVRPDKNFEKSPTRPCNSARHADRAQPRLQGCLGASPDQPKHDFGRSSATFGLPLTS